MRRIILSLTVIVALLAAAPLVLMTLAKAAEAAFPGENGKIAFTSNRTGNNEVYRMNPDGTVQQNLTSSTPAVDIATDYSPDGTKIAFSSNRDGNHEIYRMTSTGTFQTRLIKNAADDFHPAYSPDGTKIAFVSDRDGNDEIYRMTSTGLSQTRLTFDAASDVFPVWQPLP